MSNKIKIIIVIIVILILSLSIHFIFFNKSKTEIDINRYPDIEGTDNTTTNNGVTENISSKIGEDKGYDGYKITNGSLTYENGETVFKAKIKNVSKGDLEGKLVDIILLNKDGNQVSKISTYIRKLKADETMEINAKISQNVVNAYDYKFVTKTE